MKRLLLVAALLLAGAAVAGVARPDGPHAASSADTTSEHTITVSGTGTASSVPTRASFSFGVQTQAQTASAALDANATAMRSVIDALQKEGAKDIQTQTVSLSPTYGDNGQQQGYTAANSVSATVTYANAGATVDAAANAGANQISGPSPLADDQEALYRKALASAVQDARGRAEVLAQAAGATLGSVTQIAESSSPGPIVYAQAAKDSAGSTPVVSGPQDTTAMVTVTFAIS